MGIMHLIEGPVGAGKSTFARALARERRVPHINLDDWFSTLFSPDRPADGLLAWYGERKRRCLEQIWKVTCSIVDSDREVILELGLLTRAERAAFYKQADDAGIRMLVTVLDAPREVRRERVRRRNRERGDTFRMEVPDAFFELASDRWEAPDELEVEERAVRLMETHGQRSGAG